jgi:hypothetical protein
MGFDFAESDRQTNRQTDRQLLFSPDKLLPNQDPVLRHIPDYTFSLSHISALSKVSIAMTFPTSI